jgi:hypothetical protein
MFTPQRKGTYLLIMFRERDELIAFTYSLYEPRSY